MRTARKAVTERTPGASLPKHGGNIAPGARHPPRHELHRVLGNARLAGILQISVTASHRDDPCEQEAEPVAEVPSTSVPRFQRLCRGCENEVNRQPLEEDELLAAKTDPGAIPDAHPEVEAALDTIPGRGQPLPETLRAFMEPCFNADFSAVRLHTDAQARDLARAVSAQAFTVGANIVFGAGHYAPETERGRHLLAHELTHVVQQGGAQPDVIRRAPAPPPPKVPTLTVPQTKTFFTDLNAALATVLAVKANLGPADFTFKRGADFALYIKQSTDLSGDYVAAEEQASEVCAATTPKAVAAVCSTDKQCPRDLKRIQANARLCRGAKATDELISSFIRTRGVTPPAGSPSVVIEESTQNAMLLAVVHEGVHRMRGAVWRQRSRIGGGYVHSVLKPPVRLAHIGHDLDEGTVQIITDLVIAELQKVRGRSWPKGYTSTAYASAVAKVRKMLTDHGKNIGFLKRAYTALTSASEVEDLQLWQ